ncbi:unnamed protein product [Diplocarpon coronariae]
MPYITTKDHTSIYYKDWGNPCHPVVTFSHDSLLNNPSTGWPLNSDNFENQMFFLANSGYRCIAHDRRGHGRSSQPWEGNNMDQYADDLAELFHYLDLKDAMMVGHSTGGGEVVRYLTRHGSSRVSRAVLISSVTPVMVKKESNPNGTPIEVFDGFRSAMVANRAQFFLDIPTGPFFNFNRPGAKVSQGLIQSWYQQAMLCGFKNAYDCIKVFSETDMSEDLKKIKIPVLVLHGDDDQVVPIGDAALESIKLLKNGMLKVYPGGAHALPNTEIPSVNQDLLNFLKSWSDFAPRQRPGLKNQRFLWKFQEASKLIVANSQSVIEKGTLLEDSPSNFRAASYLEEVAFVIALRSYVDVTGFGTVAKASEARRAQGLDSASTSITSLIMKLCLILIMILRDADSQISPYKTKPDPTILNPLYRDHFQSLYPLYFSSTLKGPR